MSCRGRLVWDRGFLDYDFGNHPLNPIRLEFTVALATELGVLDAVDIVAPRAATREELLVAHDADYLDAVRAASADPTFSGYGLGTDRRSGLRRDVRGLGTGRRWLADRCCRL